MRRHRADLRYQWQDNTYVDCPEPCPFSPDTKSTMTISLAVSRCTVAAGVGCNQSCAAGATNATATATATAHVLLHCIVVVVNLPWKGFVNDTCSTMAYDMSMQTTSKLPSCTYPASRGKIAGKGHQGCRS